MTLDSYAAWHYVVMQSVFLTDCYYDDFHNAVFRYNVITLSIDMLSVLRSSILTVKPYWTLLPTLYPQLFLIRVRNKIIEEVKTDKSYLKKRQGHNPFFNPKSDILKTLT